MRELERLLHHAVDHEPGAARDRCPACRCDAVRKMSPFGVTIPCWYCSGVSAPVGKVLPVLEHVGAAPAHVRFELRRHPVIVLGDRLRRNAWLLSGMASERRAGSGDARGQHAARERCRCAAGNCGGLRYRARGSAPSAEALRRRPRDT